MESAVLAGSGVFPRNPVAPSKAGDELRHKYSVGGCQEGSVVIPYLSSEADGFSLVDRPGQARRTRGMDGTARVHTEDLPSMQHLYLLAGFIH